jgi:Serine dehydrogenase proteinase
VYNTRIPLLKAIEQRRNSRAILYVTGDRPGLETQIHPEVYDYFVNLLDDIGVVDRISLILYTRGGVTLAAWSIVNLIQQFCETFEVIVPSKAHSAGTLITLGAKSIVMTKQATLGPIDPSVNTPLNPGILGGPPEARVPVSVEAVNGFIELGRSSMRESEPHAIKELLLKLADSIHPLVLGEVFRSKSQIEMLGKKLLESSGIQSGRIPSLISFLCSESGSHDYSIHRREARSLGLPIEKPNDEFYAEIKRLYDNFAAELALTQGWNPIAALGSSPTFAYSNKRILIESATGGSYYFLTEGSVQRLAIPGAGQQIQDNRVFEGWRHELPPQQN